VGQCHTLPRFVKFINIINIINFDLDRIRILGVPLCFEGHLALGYTEAHQAFQRRLVDAKDDSAAGVLAEEESERSDQGRVQRWHLRRQPKSGLAVVRAGNQVVTLPSRIDLGADRARIEQTDALDAAVANGRTQFIGNCRDRQDVVGIGHKTTFRESAPVARKVDARDEDRV
jgi:hypothetical protein